MAVNSDSKKKSGAQAPVPRPRRGSPELTRERIIDGAATLFNQFGSHGTDSSESVQDSQPDVFNKSPNSAPDPVDLPAAYRARYGLHSAPAELSEHLSLLSRWFYSKPRDGEILFRDGSWPYRRILRACGRLLAPTGAPPRRSKKAPQPGK